MSDNSTIIKASGKEETFDPSKLRNSLKKSGTSNELIERVVDEVNHMLHDGITTKEIYTKAFNLLRSLKRSNAARYGLKNALMELGPTGYPFEQFVGQVLKHQGFDIQVGKTLQGKCIHHEMDVIATHNNTQYLVECKFYNSHGKFASVQVPLYVRSRVDDIIAFREKLPEYKETRFFGWVVTNTRFTSDAMQYGRCAGLHMVSWDMPENKSLKDMIEKTGVFPITALTSLSRKQKEHLLNNNIVLCRQLAENKQALDGMDLTSAKKRQILKEAEELCATLKDDTTESMKR